MKTDNLNQPGERTHGVVRGHIGRARAGFSGTTLRDVSTTATEVVDITFIGATITDNDDGTVVITFGGGAGIPFDDIVAARLFLTTNLGGQALVVTEDDAGAAYTIDCSLGNVFDLTLTANCTLSIINPPAAGVEGSIVVILRQGGAGSYTVTWWGALDWQNPVTGVGGGSAPTLYTAVGAQNVIILSTLDGGLTWGGADESRGGGSPATTVTDETTFGISPAVGTDSSYAREDHTHGTPANPVTAAAVIAEVPAHVHVAYETHTSDGSTTTFTLDNYFDENSVMAWNRTTGTMFGVTEILPDRVTLTSAGTAADLIDFHYAATVL